MAQMKISRGFRNPRRAPVETAEQAGAVLTEIDRRGISVNRFASEEGLGAERLYRWKRLLARRRRPAAPATGFAEVAVLPGTRPALIEIDLGGSITVRVCGESRADDVVAPRRAPLRSRPTGELTRYTPRAKDRAPAMPLTR